MAVRREFSDRGLDSARVDRIAELSGGNKEAPYLEVLACAYESIRAGEPATATREQHAVDFVVGHLRV